MANQERVHHFEQENDFIAWFPERDALLLIDGDNNLHTYTLGDSLHFLMETRTNKRKASMKDRFLSPDGRWLLTSWTDRKVRIWDLRKKSLHAELDGVRIHAISSDSRLFAVGTNSFSKKIHIYDITRGQEVAFLQAYASISSATFSANHQRLFTSGSSGMVEMWELVKPLPSV